MGFRCNVFFMALQVAALASGPWTWAADTPQTIASAAQQGKFVHLVFYRDNDPATKAMAQIVQNDVARRGAKVSSAYVRVTDPAEKPLVDKYKLGRAPLPLLLTLAPNGAITGMFPSKVTTADLAEAVVSPRKADCMKLLQQDKLVLVWVQTAPPQPIPQGVLDFQADPSFASRTQLLSLSVADAAEASFLAHLKIDPAVKTPLSVLIAPPGVLVGKFAPTATKADLGAALHAAGKCCDDENCQHNRQSKQPQPAGRKTR